VTGGCLVAVMVVALAAGGCAGWPFVRGHDVLERADRLAREGAWEQAAGAYGEYLRRYPGTEAAPRAAASRDTLTALLSARGELARLREEITRLRDDLARRDSDLVRVRQEADRLKTDLERLKQIDLKLERRR
jgi:succinate dehydrogenase/fumarate reductase flavoprotein subunit